MPLTTADLDMETRRALLPSKGVTVQCPAVTPATSGLRITSPACAYCSALPICKPKRLDCQHMSCLVPCKLYSALENILQDVSGHVVSAVA